MARKFLVPLGLLASASDPTGTSAGQMYYNTDINSVKIYDGTIWSAVSGGGNVDGGAPTSNYEGITTLNGGTV